MNSITSELAVQVCITIAIIFAADIGQELKLKMQQYTYIGEVCYPTFFLGANAVVERTGEMVRWFIMSQACTKLQVFIRGQKRETAILWD